MGENPNLADHCCARVIFQKTNATRPWPCDVIRISISAQQDVQCKMMCVVKKRMNKDQMDVGQNGRPRGPQMLVLVSINHPTIGVSNFDPYPDVGYNVRPPLDSVQLVRS